MSEWTPELWVWERVVDPGTVVEFTLRGPDVLCRYWGNESPRDAALIAAARDLARFVAIFLGEDPRFQIAVGGNPNAVDKMLAAAHAALAKARDEKADTPRDQTLAQTAETP